MVTICAVAFSIEALTREVAPLAVPDETRAAWRRNGTKADAMAIEILKRSVTLPHSEIEALRGALAMVVEARGNSLHFEGEDHTPVAHPTGVFASRDALTYCLENAEAAVDLMESIFAAMRNHPKPVLRKWAESHDAVLIPLDPR